MMKATQALATSTWRSVLAKPLTTLYLMASVIVVGASAGWIDRSVAIVVLTFMFLILLTLGLHRENRLASEQVNEQLDTIHTLVNSQHDDLVERVTQLIDSLKQAGVAVPEPKEKSGSAP